MLGDLLKSLPDGWGAKSLGFISYSTPFFVVVDVGFGVVYFWF